MATNEEIASLRRITDEPITDNYSDQALGDLIDSLGSTDAAAAQVWQEKAARFSQLVNVSESGSSRNLQQIYSNALDMAKFYSGRSTVVPEATETAPFTVPVERP